MRRRRDVTPECVYARARSLAISNSLSRLDPPRRDSGSPASQPERAMIDAGASGRAGGRKGDGANRVLMVEG